MEQQPTIPKYMNIGDFCRYTGLTRWHFTRLSERYHLTLIQQGLHKMVDVEQVMALLAIQPRVVQKQIPDPGPQFIDKLQEVLAAE
jgi:hypothetical protein